MSITNCKACGAPIHWIKMKSGRFMPTDREKQSFVTTDGEVKQGYISHYATCPYADQFRKGRGGRANARRDR